SSLTVTAASLTPACCSRTASISPNSTRNPRIFTCSSTRPMHSSPPSPPPLTRSPVRYSRSPPSSLNPLGTNRSAVSPACFQYPRATPAPPTYNSPAIPTPASSISSSSTYAFTFPSGRPTGGLLHSSSSPLPFSSLPLAQMIVASVGPYSTRSSASPITSLISSTSF